MHPVPEDDKFLNPPFTRENLDRFVIRTLILEALRKNLPDFSGRLLDIGCGKMPYKPLILRESAAVEYVGLDIETALEYEKGMKPDFFWDGRTMPFDNDSFDSAIATEVLEHCPDPELVLRETLRVMKPGGHFFFTVPFLWNLHEVPHDEYRYTPFSLERHLRQAGFTNIELHATGGWHAAMAMMTGLWLRRSPLPPRLRKIMSAALKPVIKKLLEKDKRYPVPFKEGQMITGLYGSAGKPLQPR